MRNLKLETEREMMGQQKSIHGNRCLPISISFTKIKWVKINKL